MFIVVTYYNHMHNDISPDLRNTVERYVREQFPAAMIDSIINECSDEDDDMIVNVIVVLEREEQVTGFSSMTRNLWSELSQKNFGFPILSFRTKAENARIFAAA